MSLIVLGTYVAHLNLTDPLITELEFTLGYPPLWTLKDCRVCNMMKLLVFSVFSRLENEG